MANLAFTVFELRSRLKNCRPCAGGYVACCPAHDDRVASLSVTVFSDRIRVKCFAGCPTEAVLDRLNLTWDDLYDDATRERRRAERNFHVRPSRPSPEPKPEKPAIDFGPLLEAARALPNHRKKLLDLADELGATPEAREAWADAAEALGVVWLPKSSSLEKHLPHKGRGWKPCWAVPERDADGRIVGLTRRYPTVDGRRADQRAFPGGQRGLIYAGENWHEYGDRSRPILCPEGASDVIAALVCGFLAIGRPSNVGGVEALSRVVSVAPPGHAVIVLGENDRKVKPDGQESWPGRVGMEKTAEKLAQALPSHRVYTQLPRGAKDTRQALAGRAGALSWEEFLTLFESPELCPYEEKRPGGATSPSAAAGRQEECGTILAGLEEPPPASRCRRGPSTLLGHVEDHGRQRCCRHACESWDCPTCRRRNAHRWAVHLAGRMTEAVRPRTQIDADNDNAIASTLHVARLRREDFDRSLSRQVQRIKVTKDGHVAHAEWAALETTPGHLLVIVAIPKGGRVPARLEPLELAEAGRLLVEWCGQMHAAVCALSKKNAHARPVRTSRGWQLDRPEPTHEWKLITTIDCRDVDAVARTIAAHGGVILREIEASDGTPGRQLPSLAWLVEYRLEPERQQKLTFALAMLDADGEPFSRASRADAESPPPEWCAAN